MYQLGMGMRVSHRSVQPAGGAAGQGRAAAAGRHNLHVALTHVRPDVLVSHGALCAGAGREAVRCFLLSKAV